MCEGGDDEVFGAGTSATLFQLEVGTNMGLALPVRLS